MEAGPGSVADEEIVYRRIPDAHGYIDDSEPRKATAFAFRPHKERDRDGLSLLRHSLVASLEQAASRPGKSTYLAAMKVGQLRALGLDVVADPKPGNPAHCLVRELHAGNAKELWALGIQRKLAEIHVLLGPFRSSENPPASAQDAPASP